ncbi:hypothetical protein VP01_260g6 [Puccinia sorghi]|uniref:peptidylprolyl isomerase n=1 Tax=Puccinia sorghi TaxID=27349 RepID=A0A0L6V4L9_9BASI|nr:hypothetical protein VP01_260g6 [Puccinia sorghi]
MSNPTNPRVFFDFSVKGGPPRRVIFELFQDRVPITAEKYVPKKNFGGFFAFHLQSFRSLCTGEKGYSTLVPQKLLCYKGSPVHRIVPNFMIQGGDFIQHNGKSGPLNLIFLLSEDANQYMAANLMMKIWSWSVIAKGNLLVMANKGPNTNQSQWFITLAAADHLTGKHVVFGRVQSGFNVVQEIGELETDKKHRPLGGADVVQIVHCGQLERKQKPRPDEPTGDPSRSDPHQDRKRHSRSASVTSSTSSRRSSLSSSSSAESSDAARRRRRQEKKDKKKARKKEKGSRTKKLKFKEKRQEDHPAAPLHAEDDPRAQEELALKKVELEHQQAERQRLADQELARLHEEKERKARALELLKNKHPRKEGGVIFKGYFSPCRGSMRYRDSDVSFGARAWDD